MSHPWLETAAAYALDADDPATRAEFETHMSTCAECRRTVHEFREIAGLLPHAVQQRTAPASLGARVADAIAAEAGAADAPGPAAIPTEAREAIDADTIPLLARPHETKPARHRNPVLPWMAAAAGLILAVSAAMLARRNASETQSVREQVATLQARLSAADSARAASDSALANLLGTDVRMASLTATGGEPVMRIFWNRDRGRFVVTAFGLPPAAPGRTYQLWAIPAAGAPVSMGTFDTNADGSATLVLPVTAAVASLGVVQATALTEEPAGGSAGPTETPRLVGAWISSQ